MIAIVFPGQGSQKPGMGRSLAESVTAAGKVFDEVGNAVGIDMRTICWDTDEETLRRTENAQLALFTCGVAAWEAFRALLGDSVVAMAGHSIGEYAALAAAGVFELHEASLLVRARGQLMASAGEETRGTMAAVLGLDKAPLEDACLEAGGIVVVANDNSPGQIVISGEIEAVDRAGKIALAKGAKRVVPLNVSGAFHSPLMREAATGMRQLLDSARPSSSNVAVYSNVTALPVDEPQLWSNLLEQQLVAPVRWTETVQNMASNGVDVVIEAGGGEVLSGLIRRTEKSIRCLRVADLDSLAAAKAELDAMKL